MNDNTMNDFERQLVNALHTIGNALSKLESRGPENTWLDSADYVEIDYDPRVYADMQRTDHITTTLADGNMRGTVTTWHDDGSTGFYISSDGDLAVKNPEELDELAERLADVYAPALHEIASAWAQRRIDGRIPTKEAA
ncbi:hypothetical protein BAAM0483_02880 [Bifidobacterium animalis subsp. animalis MCC 0483]|uniref:Uncharacterized protein n=2 Tax=Bifidobacterium animalis TaxID=28025 RepID=A0AB34TAK0_9BIFI|nr:hypothetical protein BAAM0483_02880 [Bifidobacterium animalis subsp. animalis MCC 0483]